MLFGAEEEDAAAATADEHDADGQQGVGGADEKEGEHERETVAIVGVLWTSKRRPQRLEHPHAA